MQKQAVFKVKRGSVSKKCDQKKVCFVFIHLLFLQHTHPQHAHTSAAVSPPAYWCFWEGREPGWGGGQHLPDSAFISTRLLFGYSHRVSSVDRDNAHWCPPHWLHSVGSVQSRGSGRAYNPTGSGQSSQQVQRTPSPLQRVEGGDKGKD